MKWIGENIRSYVSRFRNDVYLESPTAGGSDPDKFLGIDSNGKIIYRTGAEVFSDIGAAAGDITGVTAGTGLSGGGASGGVTLNVNTSLSHVTHLAGLASIGTLGGNTDILSGILSMHSTTGYGYPQIQLYSQSNDAYAGSFTFIKIRGGTPTDGQDNDLLGTIGFLGFDDGTPTSTAYAKIYSDIHDATAGEASGRLTFQVANHDGGLGSGLILTGGSANNTIDATIGLGTASVVTIPGDIDLAGDVDVDGTLEADAITLGGTALGTLYSPIAGSSSIVTTGTIGTGVWNGDKLTEPYTTHSQIINLKGFCTLAAEYQFAEDLEDTKAPYEMIVNYESATINVDTEVAQNWMFRANGFHVPFAATITKIQLQTTCNEPGTVTAAIVEYVPSDLGANTNDYPRTVYNEIAIASDDSNNKVDTTNVTSGFGGSGVVNAGSHLMMMAKGDETSSGGKAFFSAAIEITW